MKAEDAELWKLAACGAHSNRYGEDDDVWDSTCRRCANRFTALRGYACEFAAEQLEDAVKDWRPESLFANLLRKRAAELRKP